MDPNYATAYHWYGDLLAIYARRPDRAIPLLERALTLDPLSPTVTVTLGQAFEGVGQFEEALGFYHRAIEIEPDYPGSYMLLGQINHQAFGRLDDAHRWRSEGLSRNPRQVSALANMGMLLLDLGDAERAERWIERAMTLGPEHFPANRARAYLYRYRGQEQEAVETARKLFEIIPGNNVTVATLVTFGHFEEALQTYAASNPELTCTGPIRVTPITIMQALNLSLAFEKTGNRECADRLLEQVLEQIRTMPRLGSFGYRIADVEVYARQGHIEQALSTLRSAINDRWRALWWAQGKTSPHLESLSDHPEFIAMMAEIEADMTAQLERIRAQEKKRGGRVL